MYISATIYHLGQGNIHDTILSENISVKQRIRKTTHRTKTGLNVNVS